MWLKCKTSFPIKSDGGFPYISINKTGYIQSEAISMGIVFTGHVSLGQVFMVDHVVVKGVVTKTWRFMFSLLYISALEHQIFKIILSIPNNYGGFMGRGHKNFNDPMLTTKNIKIWIVIFFCNTLLLFGPENWLFKFVIQSLSQLVISLSSLNLTIIYVTLL